MKQIFCLCILFATMRCTTHHIPGVVKKSFEKSFSDIKKVKWDKEGHDYEARFKKDGKKMSATFDKDGTWKETETGIKVGDLPPSVPDYVGANYENARIEEAAIIETAKGKMYEAEVKGKDLLFDLNGNFLQVEKD